VSTTCGKRLTVLDAWARQIHISPSLYLVPSFPLFLFSQEHCEPASAMLKGLRKMSGSKLRY
jgi:hypothetical protein